MPCSLCVGSSSSSQWQPADQSHCMPCLAQVAIFSVHLSRDFTDSGWISVMIATQHVLMWSKLHCFARVFNPTKTLLMDTIWLVLSDMKSFLGFMFLTLVGFGFAFYTLFRQDRAKFVDFKNIWHSMATMVSYLLAMFDLNVLYNSTNPRAALLLWTTFEFIISVLLLNVLIAVMTASFNKVTQDEGLRYLCTKAHIIDELESTLPRWAQSSVWYPPFIHVLKVHPDSSYEVNLSSVWSGIGAMESNLLSVQQETRLRIDELDNRVWH